MTTILAPAPARRPAASRPLPRSVEIRHRRLTPATRRGTPPSSGRRFGRGRSAWNGVKTAALLAGLGGLLVLVGSLFGDVGAVLGLVAGLLLAGSSYWFSDRLALRSAGAVPVQPWELPEYSRAVRELCREAGLPVPRLYVTPDAQPNAFATGRSPRHAAVAVTRGLLDLLDPQELRAVLAHELAHVGNRDILLSSVAAAVASGITFLAELAGWLPLLGGADEEDEPSPLGLLLAALLAPVAAVLLQLALSRSREFAADSTGADLLGGDGRALASALAKIERAAQRRPMSVDPAQAGKYLVHPLTGRTAVFARLFSTHPETGERIRRLLAR